MTLNRRQQTFAAIALAFAFNSPQILAATPADDAYKIEAGDVLEISVWREEGLEKDVIVRPDGGLSFPLVGNVQASGKSIEQLQAEVSDKLKRFIPDPSVSVAVKQLSGNNVYVIGKVNKPGVFQVTRRVDVVQALSMAGGMSTYAAANKIQILRREGGKQTAIPFAYGDIEKGEDLQQNIVLRAGDVVVVP
ncbi:MAG: polysaccharide biosynthesis/export family protein [Gammaproteobacteria bacterium]|nr:polysaccharide biosynthesis/export family protein [Gammaproteobacteria bacterium]MBU2478443.1 polysaccharide biosynthesis/export family protein [Gammaproteobacteria bacterium]